MPVSVVPFRKTNKSAYLNFLQAKYEAYTAQTEVKSRPYYVYIDPSDICQLRCPTCPTGIENESRKGNGPKTIYRSKRSILAPELFDAVLDELGEYLFLIMFYNFGEPLLNKNLPTFIRKANDRDIETEIHTNLSLPLSDQQIDELLSAGLDTLNASVDGFTQKSYEVHRVGGDVELVKSNLERLVKARDRLGVKTRITYKFLVFSFNEHEVPAAKQFCKDHGINFLYGDAFIRKPDWLPSYRKKEEPYYSETQMKTIIAEWQVAGMGDYWQEEHDSRPFWSIFGKDKEKNIPSFCSWHYGFSAITAGGPVSPCAPAAKEIDDFGRLIPNEVQFADIWNNDRYRRSRAAMAGKRVDGLEHLHTLCVRCYFPKFIKHLYSLHDLRVIAQFYKLFGKTEPAMEKAFGLMSSRRYGRMIHALVRRGFFSPIMLLAGNGSETDTSGFVEFFEKNLN